MSSRFNFSEHDVRQINNMLDKGVMSRASNNFFLLALLFSIYGFMSAGIISKFDNQVTVWANTWPRILFNGIPFLALGLFFRKQKGNEFRNSIIWAISQPLIFVAACCVHVWPIMYDGQTEIYKYFHAANMFIITFGITFVAPSRTIMIAHVSSYAVFFLAPLLYITRADQDLSSMIVNDFACMTLGACVAGHFTYRLRQKVAFMDAQIKSTLTPFVGSTVASAIYNQSLETLNNRKSFGLILSMDLRGYTQFLHNNSRDLTSAFMKEYHFLVSTSVGNFNGFLHKTAGDSHLISFGLMDESPSLNDIPELRFELVRADTNKAKVFVEKAIQMFHELIEKYEQLKVKYDIADDLRIGAALAAGTMEIQIQGNKNYRQEVNIDGETIVRCSRLESYTKLLMSVVAPDSSMLILSPEIIENLKCEVTSEEWTIDNKEFSVRDYPELKKIYFLRWQKANQKLKRIAS